MNELKVNVTLQEIYQACCPECQDKILTLATKKAQADAIKDLLKAQMEKKETKE